MTSVVDIATFNKTLAEKSKLAAALKNLQEASHKALGEFTALQKEFVAVDDQTEDLRSQLTAANTRNAQLDAQLAHSEYLIKQICKVSRSAITEFNELKERYAAEYNRRHEAEERVIQLELHRQASPLALKSLPMENELAKIKVQLLDTMEEFERFKDLAMRNHDLMDQRIHEEITRVSGDGRQKSLMKSIGGAEMPKKTPVSTVVSQNTTLVESSNRMSRTPPSAYNSGHFDQLGALLAENRLLDIDEGTQTVSKEQTLMKLSAKSSAPVDTSDNEVDDLYDIAKSLLNASKDTKTIIEKRSSRVHEAAGHRLPGSEYSRNSTKPAYVESSMLRSTVVSAVPSAAATLVNASTFPSPTSIIESNASIRTAFIPQSIRPSKSKDIVSSSRIVDISTQIQGELPKQQSNLKKSADNVALGSQEKLNSSRMMNSKSANSSRERLNNNDGSKLLKASPSQERLNASRASIADIENLFSELENELGVKI